ncbi:MAG: alkaline phosphatase family protein [Anaerolineae bacterium]
MTMAATVPGPAQRVLVVGLDGATFRLIRPWAEAGHLPNLARLLREGAWGDLRSTIQPSSEQAWASFATGVQNGKHGIYGFVQRVPGTYELEYVNGRHQRARTLWRILSDRGRPVIVVNVPTTYPPEPVNGVLIGGLMSPGENSRFTYPDGLYQELKEAVGGYIINVDIERGQMDLAAERLLLRRMEEMTRLRTEAVLHLAATHPWDLLVVVYGAADRVSHKFWKHMDPEHPLYTPEGAAQHGEVILKTYRQLDASLGKLLGELADGETTVFVVSDHGFGPLTGALYLNQWLAEQGVLALKAQGGGGWLPGLLRRGMGLLDVPLLGDLKQRAFQIFPGLKGQLHSAMAYQGVNWARTRAYAVGTMGNIYVNLRGREPQGIVEPGAEYEDLREALIEGLGSLCDPQTQQPIFEGVYRREALYHGPYLDLAPDVVGLLDPRYHVAAVDWRRRPGKVVAHVGDEVLFVADLSGQHDMAGILLAGGKNIRPGLLEGASIVDMAPTILHALGEPVPASMDGRVLGGLFMPDYLERWPVRSADEEAGGVTVRGDGYSDEEAHTIEERLQGLGYL